MINCENFKKIYWKITTCNSVIVESNHQLDGTLPSQNKILHVEHRRIENHFKLNPEKSTEKVEAHKSMEFFCSNIQRWVRCKKCLKFLDIVKLHRNNKKPPPITTAEVTKYLSKIVQEHLDSVTHKECKKALEQSKLSTDKTLTTTSIGLCIQRANTELANHIGKLMLHVYDSCKKLTLSSYTCPARVVVENAEENFDFDKFKITDFKLNLQYVTPAAHREL